MSVRSTQTANGAASGSQSRPGVTVLEAGCAVFNRDTRVSSHLNIAPVSPRNDFLLTPLLPSTTVSTIEVRSMIEPTCHPHKGIEFYHHPPQDLDTSRREVTRRGAIDRHAFDVSADVHVIVPGDMSSTLNIPDVTERRQDGSHIPQSGKTS